MSPKQLLAHFDRIAEAPGAVPRLRRFIISLAVRGKLVAQDIAEHRTPDTTDGIGNQAGRFGDGRRTRSTGDPYDLPDSWRWTEVQQVCEAVVDCPHSTPVFSAA